MSAVGERRVTAIAIQRLAPATMALAWVPVVAWMAVIFSLSSDRFSDVHSAAWLSGIFGALGIPPAVVGVGNLIVRKTAHFVEYAALSLLTFRAARLTWPLRTGLRPLVIVLALAVACACLDELRQYVLTESRTGTIRDVLVDSTGAIAVVVFLYARARRRSTA
jgi:VanZ family protein